MKAKYLYGMLLLLLSATGFTACSDDGGDDMIWDFYPIILQIAAQDAQGNDLLNPETPGSIANSGIKAIYKGVTYEKDSIINPTKAYMAHFGGLQTVKAENGQYFLTFGEFNGDDTFDHEEVVIDWNDGTKDVINFSSKLTWKSKEEPVFDREFLLNGKKADTQYGEFSITKDPVYFTSHYNKYKIVEIRYAIDANDKDEIEADLQDKTLYPTGSSFLFSFSNWLINPGDVGTYILRDSDESELLSGSLLIEKTASDITPEIAKAYRLLPPDDMIYAYMKWMLDFSGKKHTYNVFLVDMQELAEPYSALNLWLYEDLTEYYKTKYPNAGVKEVVRLQISRYSPSE
jgi:hypothetical protein